jgi:hypothetical protein
MHIPALQREDLARATLSLLLATYLRVYYLGHRHRVHPLAAGTDPETLREIVAEARENARAERRSRKEFLKKLHADYDLGEYLSCDAFVRTHRRQALEDIQTAAAELGERACRCGVRRCDRYFAAILRRVAVDGAARRAADRQRAKERRHRERELAAAHAEDQDFSEHPATHLARALDCLLVQYRPDVRSLLFDGDGWGLFAMRRALADMRRQTPLVWSYDAEVAWRSWLAAAKPPEHARDVIRALFERELCDPLVAHAAPATLAAQARRHDDARPPPQ